MILRAGFHGIIDDDTEDSAITENFGDYCALEQNAQRMLDALKENPQPDAEQAIANIFGYLFTKAIEQTVNEGKSSSCAMRLTASFKTSEAFAGEITSSLPEADHAVPEKAVRPGTRFYHDFKAFIRITEAGEEQFVGLFKQAAVVVQRLGQLYSEKCFQNN